MPRQDEAPAPLTFHRRYREYLSSILYIDAPAELRVTFVPAGRTPTWTAAEAGDAERQSLQLQLQKFLGGAVTVTSLTATSEIRTVPVAPTVQTVAEALAALDTDGMTDSEIDTLHARVRVEQEAAIAQHEAEMKAGKHMTVDVNRHVWSMELRFPTQTAMADFLEAVEGKSNTAVVQDFAAGGAATAEVLEEGYAVDRVTGRVVACSGLEAHVASPDFLERVHSIWAARTDTAVAQVVKAHLSRQWVRGQTLGQPGACVYDEFGIPRLLRVVPASPAAVEAGERTTHVRVVLWPPKEAYLDPRVHVDVAPTLLNERVAVEIERRVRDVMQIPRGIAVDVLTVDFNHEQVGPATWAGGGRTPGARRTAVIRITCERRYADRLIQQYNRRAFPHASDAPLGVCLECLYVDLASATPVVGCDDEAALLRQPASASVSEVEMYRKLRHIVEFASTAMEGKLYGCRGDVVKLDFDTLEKEKNMKIKLAPTNHTLLEGCCILADDAAGRATAGTSERNSNACRALLETFKEKSLVAVKKLARDRETWAKNQGMLLATLLRQAAAHNLGEVTYTLYKQTKLNSHVVVTVGGENAASRGGGGHPMKHIEAALLMATQKYPMGEPTDADIVAGVERLKAMLAKVERQKTGSASVSQEKQERERERQRERERERERELESERERERRREREERGKCRLAPPQERLAPPQERPQPAYDVRAERRTADRAAREVEPRDESRRKVFERPSQAVPQAKPVQRAPPPPPAQPVQRAPPPQAQPVQRAPQAAAVARPATAAPSAQPVPRAAPVRQVQVKQEPAREDRREPLTQAAPAQNATEGMYPELKASAQWANNMQKTFEGLVARELTAVRRSVIAAVGDQALKHVKGGNHREVVYVLERHIKNPKVTPDAQLAAWYVLDSVMKQPGRHGIGFCGFMCGSIEQLLRDTRRAPRARMYDLIATWQGLFMEPAHRRMLSIFS